MTTRSAPDKTAAAKNNKAKPASRATAGTKTAAEKPAGKQKPAKVKKVKVVRDSFTMPQTDYVMIATFKEIFLKNGMHVKKSEVLRAGLHALEKLSAAQLKKTFAALEPIKTGRPRND